MRRTKTNCTFLEKSRPKAPLPRRIREQETAVHYFPTLLLVRNGDEEENDPRYMYENDSHARLTVFNVLSTDENDIFVCWYGEEVGLTILILSVSYVFGLLLLYTRGTMTFTRLWKYLSIREQYEKAHAHNAAEAIRWVCVKYIDFIFFYFNRKFSRSATWKSYHEAPTPIS